jgi:IS5 family transposase
MVRAADEALEDALFDSQALRGFAAIDLAVATVPDATTVLNFRHWLEEHDLTRALFDEVGAMLEERGLLMRQGTIVDATIIAAPPSTKNKKKARDPEMHQTKKGNQWYFGMKAHIGVDVASGVVHTLTGTAANEADINQTAALLPARRAVSPMPATPERRSGQILRTAMSTGTSLSNAASSKHCQKLCGIGPKRLSGRCRGCEPGSSIRSTSSRTVPDKRLRYRGLAKNTAQLRTLFALANLVIVKKTLLAPGRV